MEFHHIVVHDTDMDDDVEGNEESPATPDPPIWFEVLFVFFIFSMSYLSIMILFFYLNHLYYCTAKGN